MNKYAKKLKAPKTLGEMGVWEPSARDLREAELRRLVDDMYTILMELRIGKETSEGVFITRESLNSLEHMLDGMKILIK
jgi:hypothetical protein